MHRYPLTDPAIDLRGAAFVEPIGGGAVRPHRLPEHLLDRVPTSAMRLMVATSAGVRIRFTTTATRLELRAAIHPLQVIGTRAHSAAVDLVVDKQLIGAVEASSSPARLDFDRDHVEITRSRPSTLVFDSLAPVTKDIELWLPHMAVTDLFDFCANAPLKPSTALAGRRWVVHGSSITHAGEARRPTSTWPAIAARTLDYDLLNLAFAGNALLDPFVARAIRDAPADVITLKLGINIVNTDLMRLRAFGPAVHGFLDTIRDGHPETPVEVISPVLCPAVEGSPGPTFTDSRTGLIFSKAQMPYDDDQLTLLKVREELERIVTERAGVGEALSYLDGRLLLGQHDVEAGLLPDGLHPSERGQWKMGTRYARLAQA
ncbi:SGNH/GDSL hydrolase family protein [Agromyces albus]|uniref:SGNH/GDSL hydrolase family protein n=1 Tax=Agromyces albus TaxID=205332 RepID=UPI0027806502|nr:SGNH/GDSL hydrolase family protein [Agromyces albus]MDQ0577227.1 hypothetical protein [Agromyces albus]